MANPRRSTTQLWLSVLAALAFSAAGLLAQDTLSRTLFFIAAVVFALTAALNLVAIRRKR